MSEKPQVRILLLEDSTLDADIMGEYLRKGGVPHVFERVWTRPDFVHAVERGGYDLILADYTLPTFDGLSALKIARETAPEIPFILASATLGEETAIEAMKEGASDFVLKERLQRLPGAVKRALEETREKAGRRRAETRLEELNARLESIVDERTRERDRIWRLSQDLFAIFDLDGRIVSANPAWKSVLGFCPSAIEGTSQVELMHADDRGNGARLIEKMMNGDAVAELEQRYRHKDGGYRWISWRAAAPEEGRIFAVGRDVTVAREQADAIAKAEEQLRQSQKMEAIGQLTGGVAHDFNNLLTIIVGNLEALERRSGEALDARAREAVSTAMRGAQRAATLTRRLLAFSRRQPLDPKQIEVNTLVAGLSDLLDRALTEQIEVDTVLCPEPWWTQVDPNQLETAILNLAVNARDAMTEGGRLTIETENVVLDAAYCRRNPEARAGEYVCISVSDTGLGMDRDVIERAFDPFFTTKDIGQGTGLGLSQVYGFVRQTGGHIKIYSEPGRGTTVRIYLPRLVDVVEEPAAPELPHRGSLTGTETILVVEDDADVRRHSSSVLRELGYTVIEASDGASGLAAVDANPQVDLLFSDIGLPNGMDGSELAREARRRRPDLKVLFASGYARSAVVHEGRLDSGVALITKPFTFSALAQRIREVLDQVEALGDTPGGTGPARVLVVEDEPLIRMIAVDALEMGGFLVEEAGSAREALTKLESGGIRIDAALVDVGLPDRQGDVLAEEMRALRPDLPIVFASGYDMRDRIDGDNLGFIGKPYDADQIIEALRTLRVLSGGAPETGGDVG
ncbi:MAG: response regulator [Pararhizobium sp.]